MSTEKTDSQPLVLPERSQIAMTERGFEIINEGDIVVRAKVAVGSLRSLNGDIHLMSPPGEKQTILSVEAPNGTIKIIGDEFEISEIRAKEIFCDMRALNSKVIRADQSITLNRGRLQTNAISGGSIHFNGTEFSAQHVGVEEELELIGDTVQGQVITGNRVSFQMRGIVRAGKIIAHGSANFDAQSVDIDYLSAKSVRINPQTQGVIVCLDGAAPTEPNSIVGMLSPATLIKKIPSLTGLIKEMESSITTSELKPLPPAIEERFEPPVKEQPVIETTAQKLEAEPPPGAVAEAEPTPLPVFDATNLDSSAMPKLESPLDTDPLELPPVHMEPAPAIAENNPLNLTSEGAVDLGFDMSEPAD